MFFVGMFAALIRNWSDYGSSIGVAVGFFYLFGLSYPLPFEESLVCGFYLLVGAAWAMLITVFSFPFRPLNPVKRSVAKIWKANTELLDAVVEQLSNKEIISEEITKKEIALRNSINHSVDLFARRERNAKVKAQHYDIMIDLRRIAALFSATVGSMYEELGVLHRTSLHTVKDSTLYKVLSSFAQASARLSILIYTSRHEDLTMARVRVKRCQVAVELFKEQAQALRLDPVEQRALDHFSDTLDRALEYLEQSIELVENKLSLKKSDYFESYKLSYSNFTAGLNNWVFLDLVRNLINFNSEQFKYALRVSLGLCLAVFIFQFFRIDHGYWIALTMIIVIQPYYGATRKKGMERIIGTLGGVILGGLIMLLPLPHEAFVLLLVVDSFCVAYFLRNNYKVGVFFVTIMMVILMQLSQRGSLELIGWRILSTFIGALLAVVSGYLFWPVWEKERLPVLMSDALVQIRKYLEQVIRYYLRELPETENWFANRRITEAANNKVFASVQRMYEEPKRLRHQVDEHFAWIGVMIRITREITSIALVINENRSAAKLEPLSQYLAATEHAFDALIEAVSTETSTLPAIDFAAIRKYLDNEAFQSNEDLEFIKTELDKIVFELEAMFKLLAARNPLV
jgi:uncharacterized membrane protein YccC